MSWQHKNRKKEKRRFLLVSGEKVPFSFIEAYKSIRTNLKFSSVSKPYRKIVITSSLPRAGKSNFSINLAITLAADGARVHSASPPSMLRMNVRRCSGQGPYFFSAAMCSGVP